MRGFTGYLLIGSFAALAMSLAAVAGLGLAVGARPVIGPGQVIQSVNRTDKGDRLDIGRFDGTWPLRPAAKRPGKVPLGCEPVFSPLATSARNYSGRCVAVLPRRRTLAA